MKIPHIFPQFENDKALFVVTGEFEAKFYVAENGEIFETKSFSLDPREEAKEKQAFVGKKGGMQSLSAVSHHGAYILELKNKFYKKVGKVVENIVSEKKINGLYIFIPEYAKNKIVEKFPLIALEKNKGVYTGEYTKHNPLELLEMIKKNDPSLVLR